VTLALGVDVAAARKGLDLVALDADRCVVATRRRATPADVTSMVAEFGPDVVCIDAPPAWATSGRSRAAERDLRRLGITAFATPTDPGDHPFYRWMRAGIAVFAAVAGTHPRYREGPVAGTACEVFPEATAVLLAGRLRPAGESKVGFRRAVLAGHGVDTARLTTADAVDAALAALTGLLALDGTFSAVGEPSDGLIVLPVVPLPAQPLVRSR
jgi:predicted nuclease with RNAse H fold